jgi:hypothetical protein
VFARGWRARVVGVESLDAQFNILTARREIRFDGDAIRVGRACGCIRVRGPIAPPHFKSRWGRELPQTPADGVGFNP